jgi:hypothetical protein
VLFFITATCEKLNLYRNKLEQLHSLLPVSLLPQYYRHFFGSELSPSGVLFTSRNLSNNDSLTLFLIISFTHG